MTETTGREAKTIHRLLEFSPKKMGFERNPENPLEADVVILDEASMHGGDGGVVAEEREREGNVRAHRR